MECGACKGHTSVMTRLKCNACKEYYHCDCVGISEERFKAEQHNIEPFWNCPNCKPKTFIARNDDTPARVQFHPISETNTINLPPLKLINLDESDQENTYNPNNINKVRGSKRYMDESLPNLSPPLENNNRSDIVCEELENLLTIKFDFLHNSFRNQIERICQRLAALETKINEAVCDHKETNTKEKGDRSEQTDCILERIDKRLNEFEHKIVDSVRKLNKPNPSITTDAYGGEKSSSINEIVASAAPNRSPTRKPAEVPLKVAQNEILPKSVTTNGISIRNGKQTTDHSTAHSINTKNTQQVEGSAGGSTHQNLPLTDDKTVQDAGSDWTEVSYKRYKRSKHQVQKVLRGKAAQGSTLLEAADQTKYLHVYYLKVGTTEKQIQDHLHQIVGHSNCMVESLKARGHYASFKIGVPSKLTDKVLDPENWPSNSCIKFWSQPFRAKSKSFHASKPRDNITNRQSD
ncbi:hypothetical protein O0L34_g13514 [Tuta absoluta]|nr:hypothetical protein O0L34_g13514 [Tuta absoluta]